jgi:HSP20 family protein
MVRPPWDPLKELVGVHRRMNQLFERALARTNFDTQEGIGPWSPETDAYETPDSLVFEMELPGLSQDAIELRVDGDQLVVEGERSLDREHPGDQFHRVERTYGRFCRRFQLPSNVDREHVEAEYRLGVLTVRLSKNESGPPKPLKVPIR